MATPHKRAIKKSETNNQFAMIIGTTRYGDEQTFEVFSSRKELQHELNGVFAYWDRDENGFFEMHDDMQLSFWLKNGEEHSYIEGDKFKLPNVRNVTKVIWSNCTTTQIYGDVQIELNEEYGDWEAVA
ncbi:hypothetical protein [Maridesulfovibrio sp.]|uniref:hypothetical protein n=1 Tax=Maridesulfovibrio sp. TaxID=2795000 RepID=UPI003B00CA62